MNETLPPTLAAYVEATNARDAEALRRLFLPAAVVKDEGKTHAGEDAVAGWIEHSFDAYVFTLEPERVVEDGADTVLTCRVAGNFPGSPIQLGFRFTLAGDRIAALAIGE